MMVLDNILEGRGSRTRSNWSLAWAIHAKKAKELGEPLVRGQLMSECGEVKNLQDNRMACSTLEIVEEDSVEKGSSSSGT